MSTKKKGATKPKEKIKKNKGVSEDVRAFLRSLSISNKGKNSIEDFKGNKNI